MLNGDGDCAFVAIAAILLGIMDMVVVGESVYIHVQYNGLQQKFNELQRAMEEMIKENYEIKKENIILKQEVQKRDKEINILQILIKNQTEEIHQKDSIILLLKEDILKMKTTIAYMNSTIKELQKNYTNLLWEYTKLNNSYTKLWLDYHDLEKVCKELNQTVQEQSSKINDLIKRNNILKKELKSLKMEWLKLKIIEGGNGKSVQLIKCFDAKEDQCDVTKFIENCGKTSPNLFIASDDSDVPTFGGFTTQSFDGDGPWKEDKKAFTFSLASLQTCKISNPSTAIYVQHEVEKPNLKKVVLGFGKWDILISNNCLHTPSKTEINHSYDCPKNDLPFFYTRTNAPELTMLEFYQVIIK